jgi:hypothetical protein
LLKVVLLASVAVGLLQALLRLGCYHTAQTYLAVAESTSSAATTATALGTAGGFGGGGSGRIGVESEDRMITQEQQQQQWRSNVVNSNVQLQLTDLQVQLAWRLAEWDVITQQSSSSSSRSSGGSNRGLGGEGGSSSGALGGSVGHRVGVLASDWSAAAAPAAAAMLQLRDVVLQQQQKGQVQGTQLAAAAAAEPFHGSVLLLLQHLAAGESEGFRVQLQRCSLAAVTRLTSSSHQSAAAVNPALLQLQMLEMIRRAWLLRWSNQTLTKGVTKGGDISQSLTAVDLVQQLLGGCGVAPVAAPVTSGQQLSQGLTSSSSRNKGAVIPPSATAMSMYDYSLTDQLLSLESVLLSILGR